MLQLLTIWNRFGNVVSRSRNMRGIRQAVGREVVNFVAIDRRPRGEGNLFIEFSNMNWFKTDFASFDVLKDAVRRWRNLYGALLLVDGKVSGKVGYRNPALQEGRSPRTFLF